MAVTIGIEPDSALGIAAVASQSPVVFRLNSNELTPSPATNGGAFLTAGTIGDGDRVIIDGITYTARANPGPLEFLYAPTGSLAEVSDAWWDLSERINQDPRLNYKVRCSVLSNFGVQLVVTSLVKGLGKLPAISVTGGISLSLFAGTNKYFGQQFDDYKVYVDIYAKPSVAFDVSTINPSIDDYRPGRVYQDYQDDNNYDFDLSGLISSQAFPTTPDPAMIAIVRFSSATAAFYLYYGEYYTPSGGNGPRHFPVKTPVGYYQIVNGVVLPDEDNTLTPYYNTASPVFYLTRSPLKRLIRNADVTWLYFLDNGQFDYVGVEVTHTFHDGTTFTQAFKWIKASQPGLNGFRCDPEAIGLALVDASQAKTTMVYEVIVKASNDPGLGGATNYTRPKQFQIDHARQKFEGVKLVWLEPLGGYTGWTFYGQQESVVERDRQERTRNRDIVTKSVETSDYLVGVNKSTTVGSGPVNVDTFEWLRDSLSGSADVYYIDENDELVSVEVTQLQGQYTEREGIQALIITFRPSTGPYPLSV